MQEVVSEPGAQDLPAGLTPSNCESALFWGEPGCRPISEKVGKLRRSSLQQPQATSPVRPWAEGQDSGAGKEGTGYLPTISQSLYTGMLGLSLLS